MKYILLGAVRRGCFTTGGAKVIYKNANVFDGNGFTKKDFAVSEGLFSEVNEGESVDLDGAYVLPGLIDIHTHGNSGADFYDADKAGLEKMAGYYARNGITTVVPASMTLPYDMLSKAFACGYEFSKEQHPGCARIAGAHMEGPYFSEKKKGAQNGAYLKLPDFDGFRELYNDCCGFIKIVDIAPELEGAVDFIERAKELCTVSVGHTDASYEEARAAFGAGATHVTHLYNAMPALHHRKPGVIGAASENGSVTAELICDGQHIHESAVRAAFKMFPGRICLISDSLRCTGMPDGKYEFGGQPIWLEGSVARLEDGNLAGSASNLFLCMKNAIRFGIPVPDAINAATIIPAREICMDDTIGSIDAGKSADFIVCDRDFNLQKVFIRGTSVE